MLLLAILNIAVLALINYRIGGRVPFYPPVVFCSVWAADLLLIWAVGDYFLPLSALTLFIFTCGCIVFSIGSFAALMFPPKFTKKQLFSGSSSRNLNLLIVLFALLAPFFVHWIFDLASNYNVSEYYAVSLLMAVRFATVVNDPADSPPGYSVIMNLATLSIIVALISYCAEGKKRRAVALALAIALNLFTATRTGIVMLLLPLVFLEWIQKRQLPRKLFGAILVVFLLTSSVIAIQTLKGDARADAPLAENIVPLLRGLVDYTAGGIVAFDRVIRDPSVVPHNWQINRFFLETLNKLGARFDVPSLHAEFVDIGPIQMNVYTIYFAYLDLGYAGMMLIVFLLGVITTSIYTMAIAGNKISALLCSALLAGLALSIFSENFFLGLNFLLKLYGVAWVFFRLPVLWRDRAGVANVDTNLLVPRVARD